MDTMYRKKAREAEEALSRAKKKTKQDHVADHYSPKLRPRETHPDAIEPEKRIAKNLNKLKRELSETPAATPIKGKAKTEEGAILNEDRGAKVITRAAAAKAQAPISVIFSCVLIAVVFMYMLSLYIQIEEYSYSIDQMESEIAELKDEATQLEVQLENKYDLGEVERIATQELGMVAASTLPKKYISVATEEDIWQKPEQEEKTGFFERIAQLFSSKEDLGE